MCSAGDDPTTYDRPPSLTEADLFAGYGLRLEAIKSSRHEHSERDDGRCVDCMGYGVDRTIGEALNSGDGTYRP